MKSVDANDKPSVSHAHAVITYLVEPDRLRFRRIVFVLGAGASYDHGYPLVREFLSSQYFRWLCDQCAGMPAGYGDQKDMLEEFLAAVDRYRLVAADFERVLSALYPNPTAYAKAVDFVYRALATAYEITQSNNLGSTAEHLRVRSPFREPRKRRPSRSSPACSCTRRRCRLSALLRQPEPRCVAAE